MLRLVCRPAKRATRFRRLIRAMSFPGICSKCMCCTFRFDQDLFFSTIALKLLDYFQDTHITVTVCSPKNKNVIILLAVAETFNFFVHSSVRQLCVHRNLQDANVLKGSVRFGLLETVKARFHLYL